MRLGRARLVWVGWGEWGGGSGVREKSFSEGIFCVAPGGLGGCYTGVLRRAGGRVVFWFWEGLFLRSLPPENGLHFFYMGKFLI